MAESGAESSPQRRDSFTHLKIMQNAAHIYAPTSSNGGASLPPRPSARKQRRFLESPPPPSTHPNTNLNHLNLNHLKMKFLPKYATCVSFFFFLPPGPDLQPVSAHVGHNGRLLSAVEVVIIRHGARHRGGAHCSPAPPAAQSVTTEGELIVHSV